MAIIKTLKNVSGNKLQILDVDVLNGQAYTIDPNKWLKLATNESIISYVTNGSIVVNNGTSDLSVAEALLLIKRFQPLQDSNEIPFDNSINGFTATNVQAAIEEAKNTNSTIVRTSFLFAFDGNASTGRWLETDSNIPSNVSGCVIPLSATIKDLSLSCSANSTITINIYKNGVSATSISLSSQRKNKVNDLDISLNALDEISAKVTSGSCTRPILLVFVSF